MAVAEGLLRSGLYKRILLCGVEVLSGYVNWQDRGTCVLFGDGAGAAVLGPASDEEMAEGRGVLSVHLFADGTQAETLSIPGGGSLHPTSPQTWPTASTSFICRGKVIFTHAVRNLASACLAALGSQGLKASDIDLIVAHQANLRILEGVAQRLGVTMERFYINIDRYGNTSSASVPIALDEAVRDGHIKRRSPAVLCAGCGSGLGRRRRALVTPNPRPSGALTTMLCLCFSRPGLAAGRDGTRALRRLPLRARALRRSRCCALALVEPSVFRWPRG